MTSTLIPQGLIDQLGWNNRLDQTTQLSSGFSGARVFRVSVRGQGEFAIKRLPAGTTPARIAGIHHAVDRIRNERGLGLPEFKGGLIQADADLWEVSNWQIGAPLPLDADASQIATGARAIGAFHRVSMKVSRQTSYQIPKSITERISRLSSITTDFPSPSIVSRRYLDSLGVSDSLMRNRFETILSDAMTTLRQGWPVVGDELIRRLHRWAKQPIACCFVMRDIHRENALFDSGQVRFIDLDAARIDTPALDLARWIGSFLTTLREDIDAIFSASLAEYAQENPSLVSETNEWSELLRLLQQSGTWGSLANWVDWVIQGRLFEAGIEAVSQRISLVADAARASLRT